MIVLVRPLNMTSLYSIFSWLSPWLEYAIFLNAVVSCITGNKCRRKKVGILRFQKVWTSKSMDEPAEMIVRSILIFLWEESCPPLDMTSYKKGHFVNSMYYLTSMALTVLRWCSLKNDSLSPLSTASVLHCCCFWWQKHFRQNIRKLRTLRLVTVWKAPKGQKDSMP